MTSTAKLIAGLSLAALVVGSAHAAPFVPTGVSPGSPYHLVFVTRDGRDASSSLIGDYNTFVNGQAALNPTLTGNDAGVLYYAIGSTTTIHARVNALVSASVPVYNFNDEKVADNFADMWDGSLDNAINYDQFAAVGFPDMYTGSDLNGFAFPGFELGAANVRTGLAFSTNPRWIDDSNLNNGATNRFYALSGELFAPGTGIIPEPATAALLAAGLCGTLLRRRPRCPIILPPA